MTDMNLKEPCVWRDMHETDECGKGHPDGAITVHGDKEYRVVLTYDKRGGVNGPNARAVFTAYEIVGYDAFGVPRWAVAQGTVPSGNWVEDPPLRLLARMVREGWSGITRQPGTTLVYRTDDIRIVSQEGEIVFERPSEPDPFGQEQWEPYAPYTTDFVERRALLGLLGKKLMLRHQAKADTEEGETL